MFTSTNEQDFFFKHLNSNQRVLEYGSGQSTIEIASKVKEIVSIEHQRQWYEMNDKDNIPNNCKIYLVPPNDINYVEGKDCGSYEQFKDYIEYPLKNLTKPFDIILIDGRARVACASICKELGDENTIIFIHDFDRVEYQTALQYLTLVEQVETMGKFKLIL